MKNGLQIVVWILGAIAAFRLWEDNTWLSVLTIILAISYGAHGYENWHFAKHGEYSDGTAIRLMMTFTLVAGIFIYSLFV